MSELQDIRVLMLLDNPFQSDARVEKEISTLLQAGANIEVMCERKAGLPEKEFRDGYTIFRCMDNRFISPLRKGYTAFIAECCAFALHLEFDILHAHDFYMLRIGAEIKKKKPSVRLIYDAHEYLAGWPFYKNSSGLNKWKGRLVWQQLLRNERKDMAHADKVITITDSIAQRMQKYTSAKVEVVGNFPVQTSIAPDPDYFRSRYGIGINTRILVHTGTIYQDDHFLHAAFDLIASQSDFALIFVGNRPRFEEIRHQVEKHENWKKWVFFHPYPANQTECIQLLSHADAGWLFVNDVWEAHRIGFSNRFVEYLAAGLPVVASPQAFTRAIHAKYPCSTFYSAVDFASFEKALQELCAKYTALKSGAEEARKTLNWETEAQNLIRQYQP